MKRIADTRLESGDLYLFTPTAHFLSGAGLWGIFDRIGENGEIRLEVYSPDFEHFRRTATLPPEYLYCGQPRIRNLRFPCAVRGGQRPGRIYRSMTTIAPCVLLKTTSHSRSLYLRRSASTFPPYSMIRGNSPRRPLKFRGS